ncbi:MAG: DUF262 domain-containing protein [Bacteroidetes bacterium]|nr:DUF262 domain-containing protein [Bacteroidota bacterium]MBU1115016.1 DUF262 domain-containing protein [Bacteroidota bacterium]MBU1799508.1 DUF262 domain-containing protein [Bacteroidota bacterium]
MKTKYTFWELLRNYGVEIPKIQRDYAQGRKDIAIVKIVDKFLEDIKESIKKNEELNLDFVYGKVENNILIPLDGQQRLTTLFLIHWYIVLKENKLTDEIKSVLLKFTYETRVSSGDFCKSLINENIDYNAINGKISNTIKDSKWYYLSWELDPTVSAMLNMLDTIHSKFKDLEQPLFEKLEKGNNVTFQFLPLEQFKLTDELYIKMNARGKPLTEFENFKANFSQYLTSIEEKSKLDNEWLDVFWNFEKNEHSEIITKNVDEKFFNFFKNITLNFYAELKPVNKEIVENFNLFDNYQEVYQSENNVNQITKILDGLIDYEDIKKIFIDFLSSSINYWQRIRFYSLGLFFINYGKITDENEYIFKRWLRVSTNLINNTLIQSADNYQDAIRAIKKLSENIEDIYTSIGQSSDTIEYFLGIQRKEESTKAKLIIENSEWEELFSNIEQHPYFDGQIGFILEYSKDQNNNYDKDIFRSSSQILSKLFGKEFREKYDYLFQRALLTKGNYLVDVGQNKTFCIFDEALRTKMDNWRKVFNDNLKTKYLKELLMDVDEYNIKDSLIAIVRRHSKTNWMKYIIEKPDNISYCNYRQIRFYSDKIYLLSKVQMNGMHRELNSWDLYEHVFQDKIFMPFQRTRYYESKSTEEPHIFIGPFDYDKNKYYLIIEFFGTNKFRLKLCEKITENHYWHYSPRIPDKFSKLLISYGFDKNTITLKKDEIEPKIETICDELQKLKD